MNPHPIYFLYSCDENGKIQGIRKEIIPHKHASSGYCNFTIRHESREITMPAHKFVWECHKGFVPDGLQIDHKDDDKHNFKLNNLQLLTASENCLKRDRLHVGRGRGAKNAAAKLTEDQAISLISMLKTHTNTQLGELFKLHPQYVSLIRTGRRWIHIPR